MKRKISMVLFLVLLAIFTSGMTRRLRNYRQIVREIEITDIDLGELGDGVYYGVKDAEMVKAQVWVTVENNQIIEILLKHDHGRGAKAEAIIENVKREQTLKVDFISGATSSSKVILKAIEKALNSNPIE